LLSRGSAKNFSNFSANIVLSQVCRRGQGPRSCLLRIAGLLDRCEPVCLSFVPRCAGVTIGDAKLVLFELEIALGQGQTPAGSISHRIAKDAREIVLASVGLFQVFNDLNFRFCHLVKSEAGETAWRPFCSRCSRKTCVYVVSYILLHPPWPSAKGRIACWTERRRRVKHVA
jgi:hypothetical protein